MKRSAAVPGLRQPAPDPRTRCCGSAAIPALRTAGSPACRRASARGLAQKVLPVVIHPCDRRHAGAGTRHPRCPTPARPPRPALPDDRGPAETTCWPASRRGAAARIPSRKRAATMTRPRRPARRTCCPTSRPRSGRWGVPGTGRVGNEDRDQLRPRRVPWAAALAASDVWWQRRPARHHRGPDLP